MGLHHMMAGRRVLAAAFATAFGLGVGGTALATDETHFMIDTAGDLAKLCGAEPGTPNYVAAVHMCQGYISGAHHFHEALAEVMDEDLYCEEVRQPVPTRNEVMAEFSAWIAANPDVAEGEAIEGLMAYAAAAFPCS